MVTIEEYASYDATGLAGLVRSGEVKPAEIHEAGIKAVELANERLHATVEGPWDSPLDASTEGVFAGVPFVLKDLCCHAAGYRSTWAAGRSRRGSCSITTPN